VNWLLPRPGDVRGAGRRQNRSMSNASVLSLSNALADAVDAAAPSVVQVQGPRRAVSGVVFAPDAVVTTARALGRDGGARVRAADGRTIDAEVAGWDPSTNLVALRVPGLGLTPAHVSDANARVGSLALALARSFSNSITASLGIVSIVGGPLPTGRGRAIDHVIRTTAPMHDGFAGGAFVDVEGHLIGISTAAEIRGLAVVIPAAIAVNAVQTVLARGTTKRGYLGVAGQPVGLGEAQAAAAARDRALLVVNVAASSPAATAGLLVGDLVLAIDDRPIESAEELLDYLWTVGVGREVRLRVLRGSEARDLAVTAAERPHQS
jgi:S1-C subfamily serine protease